jgi:arylsulfatase A-like enzyme
MCHHKAPHRPWDPKPEHRTLYNNPIPKPENFDDDYANRGEAASAAQMRIVRDMTYDDLDLVQVAESPGKRQGLGINKMVPHPENLEGFALRCRNTGELFTFETREELADFKYQRYLRKYLQCVHSVDENVGHLLDWLEEQGLSDNTLVIYTSDQGFYLGEHGWFDKRFIYEESFKMPFLARLPGTIPAGMSADAMASNVDFAPTFLDAAGLPVPNYMQGRSLLPVLCGTVPEDWTEVAYHRYWMHRDPVHNAYAHYGIRTHDYKLIYWYKEDLGEKGAQPGGGEPEWELFDLQKDPQEMRNVYHETEYVEVVRDMTRRLDAEMARIGDTPCH